MKKTGDLEIVKKILLYENIQSKRVVDLLSEMDGRPENKVAWNEYGLRIGDINLKAIDIISEKCLILLKFRKSKSSIWLHNEVGSSFLGLEKQNYRKRTVQAGINISYNSIKLIDEKEVLRVDNGTSKQSF